MSESDPKSRPGKKAINWPNIMLEMAEVIEHSIDKEMDKDASPKHLAKSAVIAICSVMGGSTLYIPYGKVLERKLMREALYRDFLDGMEHKDLIKKYKTSSQTVYRIIAEGSTL